MTSTKKPNILLVMLDQLAPHALGAYGNKLTQTPNISGIADKGVVFDNFYCNSALCGPSRFSFMTGQANHKIGAYDNASEFPASIPTFAHYLRLAGYRTCLSGKMHFVGADQLHGFEDRVTTDMYPGDFGWTPTWEDPERIHWWFHNMLSVTESGAYDRTLEIDYDEEVAWHATRWLWDHTRGTDERPFMMCLSLMHPHDPYMAPRHIFDRYRADDVEMPAVPYIPYEQRDPFSQRMWKTYDRDEYEVTETHIRTARQAYSAMITYADELIGQVMAPLHSKGVLDNTVVIVTADHGDMLGERGLWFKMVYFERSIRVPLIMSWPGHLRSRRVTQNASLIDILPTLVDIATEGKPFAPAAPLGGASLMPLARGESKGWADTVYGEYMAEGTFEPAFMIKRGNLKYITAKNDPPQLYDTAKDPNELTNLAGSDKRAADFAAEAATRWDSDAIRADVIRTQNARIIVQDALVTGRIHPWDYEPKIDASKIYNRNYGAELYDTDRRARVPLHPEPPKKKTRRNWSRDVK
ncbi:MAG: choline-sulfatase [Hyphomicrobiaceae bacterium]